MCWTLRPRSSTSVFIPFSHSSFAAQPPEMPEPMTIASYAVACALTEFSLNVEARRSTMARVDHVGKADVDVLLAARIPHVHGDRVRTLLERSGRRRVERHVGVAVDVAAQ